MLFMLGLGICYLFFHLQFVRAIRLDKLGIGRHTFKRQWHPLGYTLTYCSSCLVLGYLLNFFMLGMLDQILLPEDYQANMQKAAAMKVNQLHGNAPLITAHRGLSSQYPENTLISFQAAIKHQPDYVELDFRTTADGHLVCIHDANLNRYLGKQKPNWQDKPTESFTLEQLQTLDFGNWKSSQHADTPVATLKQVITLFNELDQTPLLPTLMLEHKTGTVDQLLQELDAFTNTKQYLVQSFNWQFLQELKSKRPIIRIAAIGGGALSDSMLKQVMDMGCYAVHWNDQITPEAIQQLHQHGIEVWVYTLNHPRQWGYANQIGIDAITTDQCDALRELINGFHRNGQ